MEHNRKTLFVTNLETKYSQNSIICHSHSLKLRETKAKSQVLFWYWGHQVVSRVFRDK